MTLGKYSNAMRGAYWYSHCKPYFNWGYDPCKDQNCYDSCVVMCERSYEFKQPGFLLHYHGCNLNCRFCWAYRMRQKPSISKTPEEVSGELLCKLNALSSDRFIMKSRVTPHSISTIRLTGNEPTLQWTHIIELLKILDDQSRIRKAMEYCLDSLKDEALLKILGSLKVLIQTNGIEVGKKDCTINVEDLKSIKNLDITIEVSFKGVNPDQFAWLADSPADLFECQCAGFKRLWEIQTTNIHVVPELGIGHSENIKGYPDLAVRIIDDKGEPLDFTAFHPNFKEKVLNHATLSHEINSFQEFGEINKERARAVAETYHKTTGQIRKRCLPSEFTRYKAR